MGRRTTSQRVADDQAFAIRVKVKAPGDDFCRNLGHILSWLNDELGPGGFGYHSGGALGGDVLGFYFRSLEDARRFQAAFPEPCQIKLLS